MITLSESVRKNLIEGVEQVLFKKDLKGRYVIVPVAIDTKYGTSYIELKIEVFKLFVTIPKGPLHDPYREVEYLEITEDDII